MELKDLNGIKNGCYKKWVLKDKKDSSKVGDFLQKINYSIQDLNSEIKNLSDFKIKDIVFIVVLSTWIQEATNSLFSLYKDEILKNFVFSKEKELKCKEDYLKALRSFVVAHPLKTNRHEKLGLDGDFICVDIRTKRKSFVLLGEEYFYHMSFDGISKIYSDKDDFYLYVYSKREDHMKFSRYIGCSINDIFSISSLFIEKIYAFEKYLNKQKKKYYN